MSTPARSGPEQIRPDRLAELYPQFSAMARIRTRAGSPQLILDAARRSVQLWPEDEG